MPAEEIKNRREALVEALSAIDTGTLQAVARETGIGERTLWRYRRGNLVPVAKLIPLERALGLSSRSRGRDESPAV